MGTACTMPSSTVVCGSEQLSLIFRLLTACAAVKYRDVLIQSLQYAFPIDPLDTHVRKANTLIIHALHIGTWGSDFHLFPLSLLLDRPIFTYVYFYCTDARCVKTLMLADIDNIHVFAQRFLAFASGTRQHIQWCSSAHRAMLMSGEVTTLPHLPLALFFFTQSLYCTSASHPLCYSMCPFHLAKCSMTKQYPTVRYFTSADSCLTRWRSPPCMYTHCSLGPRIWAALLYHMILRTEADLLWGIVTSVCSMNTIISLYSPHIMSL